AIRGALVYLLAYMFTNLGAFAVAIAVEKDDGSGTDLEDFVGLSRTRPALALMMAFFMLSLIGIPLTGGFIGKLLVFQASLEAGLLPLVIIAIITSVISAFYYARVIVNMYLREGEGAEVTPVSSYLNWAIYAMAAGTFILGVFPPLVTNLTDMVTLVAMLP
ncbi:MAG: NADH-quinone oxidoreductase subunit N, partial [Chloroflexi bacterium]